jgi:folate-binding protein YgfZ
MSIKTTRRPNEGCLFISGPQATPFLQGQLTCDVNSCPTLGGYCNIQGRLVSIFHLSKQVWKEVEGYWLICPLDILESTLNTLKKYAVFSKVTFEDITESVDIDTSKTLEQDILAKIPSLSAKTQALFLPHHLNLPQLGAVSFNKGCYLGQEIVARMEYKGKIKKHLAVFEYEPSSDCNLEAGSPIYHNDELVGHIVNLSDKFILACVADEALEAELRAGAEKISLQAR